MPIIGKSDAAATGRGRAEAQKARERGDHPGPIGLEPPREPGQ